jgi:hypothetical protein
MADTRLSIFCVVDGEPQSRKFSVKPKLTDTIDDVKDLIKAKKSPRFDDIAADKLTLWKVSIPIVPANKDNTIALNEEVSRTYLEPAHKLSNVFENELEKNAVLTEDTLHILVERPPPGNAHALCSHSHLTRELVFLF